jgi:radical SAM protein with 4Fe4S-binding SPASM domain
MYDYGKEMEKGFMDFDLLKKIIIQAYPHIDSIGLTGLGEPLLYPKINEAVDFIKSVNKGIIISLSTNAHLDKIEEKISPLINKVDTIQISIDGIGNVYEQVRKNANFSFFDQNIQKILALAKNSDTDIMFNSVIMKENYKQMSDLINYSVESGVPSLNFTLFNLASATDFPEDYYAFFASKEFKSELVKAKKLAERFKDQLEFTTWDYESTPGFKKCPFPWTHFYFSWDGYFTPCCAKPFPKELNFGSINNNTLIDGLNTKAYKGFRSLAKRNITPDFCKKCHFIDIEPIHLK